MDSEVLRTSRQLNADFLPVWSLADKACAVSDVALELDEACSVLICSRIEDIEVLRISDRAAHLILTGDVEDEELNGLLLAGEFRRNQPVVGVDSALARSVHNVRCSSELVTAVRSQTRVVIGNAEVIGDSVRVECVECECSALARIGVALEESACETLVAVNECPFAEFGSERSVALKVLSDRYWIRSCRSSPREVHALVGRLGLQVVDLGVL